MINYQHSQSIVSADFLYKPNRKAMRPKNRRKNNVSYQINAEKHGAYG